MAPAPSATYRLCEPCWEKNMNSLRSLLPLILLSLCTMTFAQSDAHTSVAKPAPSDAQKSFDKLKTVAGSWVGQLTTSPQEPTVEGKFAQFSLRVTSMGNALVHEISVSGRPDQDRKSTRLN